MAGLFVAKLTGGHAATAAGFGVVASHCAFDGSTGSAAVSVATLAPGSVVVVSITPNPAHEGQSVKAALTEVNGVATILPADGRED